MTTTSRPVGSVKCATLGAEGAADVIAGPIRSRRAPPEPAASRRDHDGLATYSPPRRVSLCGARTALSAKGPATRTARARKPRFASARSPPRWPPFSFWPPRRAARRAWKKAAAEHHFLTMTKLYVGEPTKNLL